MKKVCVSIFLFVILSICFPDQNAIADDGKQVVLKDDGTWEIISNNDAANTEIYNFRKTRWGMSQAEVTAIEGEPLLRQNTYLAYSVNVNSIDAVLAYYFLNDRLHMAKYLFQVNHASENEYLHDYYNMSTLLKKKYGEPTEEKTIWSDDLYKYDSDEWGFAVSIGDAIFYSRWETEDTIITILLSGDNYKISHQIEYIDPKTSGKAQEEREGKALDDL